MIKLKISFILIFMSGFTSLLNADTIYLKNGRSIEGLIKSEDGQKLELEVSGGTVGLKKREIQRIEKASADESLAIRQKWAKENMEMWEKISRQRDEEERRPPKIQFSQSSQNIIVTVTLNKKVDASLVLDTGAQIVMLRKKIAAKLGIKLENLKPDTKVTLADGRAVNAKYINLESIRIENVEANNVEATILLDEAGADELSDGLLGMSFLKRFNFKIDHKAKKLILEKL